MSFELLTFPCREILNSNLPYIYTYITRFQNEYISIHRPITCLLCDTFIVYTQSSLQFVNRSE